MKINNKILSWVLALIITVSSLPISAYAEEMQNETEENVIVESQTEEKSTYTSGATSTIRATDEITLATTAEIVPARLLGNISTSITRGEFCELIITMLNRIDYNLPDIGDESVSFSDVPEGNEFFSSIESASSLNIVSGYADGKFLPNKTVSRQEAAVMLKNTADLLNLSYGSKTSFSDSEEIASWARDKAALVSSLVDDVTGNHVMDAEDGSKFNPLSLYTRKQAIADVLRLYDISNHGETAELYNIDMPYTDIKANSEYYDAILWLAEQGVVTQENDSSRLFRPDDNITLEEYLAMLVSLHASSDEYVTSGVTNDWSDVYVSTAASLGIINEEFYAQKIIYVTNVKYHRLSFENVPYRFIWALLDNIEVFDFYPIWCFDGSEPRAYNECYEVSIEYMMNYCGWNEKGYSLETDAKRGDVALLLYKTATENEKEPTPEITSILNITDDGTSSLFNLRTAKWGIYYGMTLLPQKYVDSLNNRGIRILLSHSSETYLETLGQSKEDSGFSGIYSESRKLIGIMTKGASTVHLTFLHEVGHAVRYASGGEARNMVFYMYDIEKEPMSKLYRAYCLTNQEEMFADAFSFVIRNRDNPEMYKTMQEQIPYTLAVIEQAFLDADGTFDMEALREIYSEYTD